MSGLSPDKYDSLKLLGFVARLYHKTVQGDWVLELDAGGQTHRWSGTYESVSDSAYDFATKWDAYVRCAAKCHH